MEDDLLATVTVGDDEFTCTVPSHGGRIPVTVSLSGASFEEGVVAAHHLAGVVDGLLMRTPDLLVEAFLPLINRGYLADGEDPLTRDELLGRAALARVDLDVDGDLTFIYADDDMLWGHWMCVHTDLSGSTWRTSMWG